ncbi:hypothetical protein VTO73DRAFT_9867 [Trametes versicolor]
MPKATAHTHPKVSSIGSTATITRHISDASTEKKKTSGHSPAKRELHNARRCEQRLRKTKDVLQGEVQRLHRKNEQEVTHAQALEFEVTALRVSLAKAEEASAAAEDHALSVEDELETARYKEAEAHQRSLQVRSNAVAAIAGVREEATDAIRMAETHAAQAEDAAATSERNMRLLASQLQTRVHAVIMQIAALAQWAVASAEAEAQGVVAGAEGRAYQAERDMRAAVAATAEEWTHMEMELVNMEDTLREVLRIRAETLHKRNDTLRKKVERGRNTTSRAAEKAVRLYAAEQEDSVALDLKTKGVIASPVWDLIRDLVALGLKVSQIKGTISAVARTAGTPVKGSLSERSVGRIVLEGGVYAKLQIAEDVMHASSVTASSDGTTHQSINLDSRHLHTHNGASHERRFLGIHSTANHTSESQLSGWQVCVTDIFNTYNASPIGREKPADVRTLAAKTEGILTDHAKDQKKVARLFKQWKLTCKRELRGKRVLAGMSLNDVLRRLTEEMLYLIAAHPEGEAAEDPDVQAAQARRAVALKLGQAEYAELTEEDKARVDRFVHAGCCMHKELNSVKGGNTEMVAYWAVAGVQGPVLLMNKGNGAAASHGPSPTQQHAAAVSRGGAVKAAELAGHLFCHKDNKKGQQNIFRYHFEAVTGLICTFPDTSNTRYQSYCGASAELLVHLPLYRRFLEQIRDKKISGQFAHLEQNVQKALEDIPTLTEFCALALYAQAISHPYMRDVRGAQNPNHLDLGPLHEQVVAHCKRIIEDPSLLLAPDATPEHGTLNGQDWERAEVFTAIRDLAPELLHLEGVLVVFFKGALKTWQRFSAEYASGGAIAALTPSER